MATNQPVGRQFGRFIIQQKLGTGGVATVYKALDTSTNDVVALKIMHDTWSPESDMAKRFQREADIAGRLEHPHIVNVRESGSINGRAYLLMEFLKGGSLAQRFNQPARITTPATIKLLRQIGSALDYAHAQGVIHRDMKLENILLSERGAALADFGIARVVGASKFTVTGNIVGTPLYMSPEQARARGSIDYRADLYSLSVLAYLLVVGCFPFSGEDVLAIIAQHISAPPPVPSALTPEISAAVDSVLLKGLAKKPDDRYQSAGQFVDALGAALQTAPLTQTLVDVHIVVNHLMGDDHVAVGSGIAQQDEGLSADDWYNRAIEAPDDATRIRYLKQALKLQPMHSAANRALFRLEGAKPQQPSIPAPTPPPLSLDDQPPLDAIAPLPGLERAVRRAPTSTARRGGWNLLGLISLFTLLVLCPMVTLRVVGVGTGLAAGFKVLTGGPTPIAELDGEPIGQIPDAVYHVPDSEKLLRVGVDGTRIFDILDGGYAHEYVFIADRRDLISVTIQFFSFGAGNVSPNVGILDPALNPADGSHCQRSGTPFTFLGEASGTSIICEINVSGEWSVRIFGRDGSSNGMYMLQINTVDVSGFLQP